MIGDSDKVVFVDDRYGFEFKHQYEQGKPEIIVRVHADATLDDIADAFGCFLKAVGYDHTVEVTIQQKDTPNV